MFILNCVSLFVSNGGFRWFTYYLLVVHMLVSIVSFTILPMYTIIVDFTCLLPEFTWRSAVYSVPVFELRPSSEVVVCHPLYSSSEPSPT